MVEYFYLYGFINSTVIDNLGVKGVKGENVLIYKYNNYSLIYSIIDVKKLDAEYNTLMQHEEVLEILMNKYDVLPFSFSTILLSENSLEKVCKKYDEKIITNFKNVLGRAEMGVKIINRESIEDDSIQSVAEEDNGYDYMIKKFKDFKNRKKRIEEIKLRISPFEKIITNLVLDEKKKYYQSNKIIFNASYLVSKENIEKFKSYIDQLELEDNLEVIMSGPWPPYSFVSFEREDGE